MASHPAAGPTQWGSDPEFFGPRHQARLALLERVLGPKLPAAAQVLDVGSGAGHFANQLAARGHHVTGVDSSEAFVAYATARARPGAQFVRGEAAPLAFLDATFDAVVASEVLEHLDDDQAAVLELARVLKPGGWCLVSVPADPARWDASDDWAGHRRRYTEIRLRAPFEAAGLTVVRCFHWGFPLTRLYHRAVYLPMLSRKQAAGGRPSPPLAGWKRLASGLVAQALRLDRFFEGHAGGLGLVLLARKPG